MPESATDRPASALEYVFMLTKNSKYFFDMDSIRVAHSSDGKGGFCNKKNSKRYGLRMESTIDAKVNPAGRNYRNTDLFYESIKPPHGLISTEDELIGLDVNPQAMKEAHFATFPEKLVEPLIRSGTSEKGCCPECLEPWVRVVEKESIDTGRGRGKEPSQCRANLQGPQQAGVYCESKTIGWKPGCKTGCHTQGANPIPCTVLDPFSGSGTVSKVAQKHGRKSIGIELSEEYIKIATDRLRQGVFNFT